MHAALASGCWGNRGCCQHLVAGQSSPRSLHEARAAGITPHRGDNMRSPGDAGYCCVRLEASCGRIAEVLAPVYFHNMLSFRTIMRQSKWRCLDHPAAVCLCKREALREICCRIHTHQNAWRKSAPGPSDRGVLVGYKYLETRQPLAVRGEGISAWGGRVPCCRKPARRVSTRGQISARTKNDLLIRTLFRRVTGKCQCSRMPALQRLCRR